ncbi:MULTISPECIES: hypothetical protein [Streptomyces]|uniref:hypothetical protein n=1 Tax=Streptomyces TaxID=1883 RepID=UPI000A3C6160|nr:MULTISPECIES: hypothetical protein [Streptomyces]MDX3617759.1 hypothetical protein [Streptomyces europaeiscabiei]MDX3636455.1 hypothetical protein [Streptomyces europaeiscabiei]MDX3654450.1 hypothetical protein [Streptomyces europaeiscabiei]
MTAVQNGLPATPRTEIPMLRAYRLWFEHTRKCADGCRGTPKAQDGCEDGRQLWGTYRLARIGRAAS